VTAYYFHPHSTLNIMIHVDPIFPIFLPNYKSANQLKKSLFQRRISMMLRRKSHQSLRRNLAYQLNFEALSSIFSS
jgi:hypothetical protein